MVIFSSMQLTAPEERPIGVVRHNVIKMRTHKWTGTHMLIAFGWIYDIWLVLYNQMVSTNTSECVCVCKWERDMAWSVLKYILWVLILYFLFVSCSFNTVKFIWHGALTVHVPSQQSIYTCYIDLYNFIILAHDY